MGYDAGSRGSRILAVPLLIAAAALAAVVVVLPRAVRQRLTLKASGIDIFVWVHENAGAV